MPENTNINNNAAVVVVGRTAPVPTGQQSAEKSIPVVVASDQEAIPVEEQNKQQSEVALSLLGIPRSEVALGIFADVNTYDVNPSEWTADPVQLRTILASDKEEYTNIPGQQDWGLNHVPSEAGAHIEAPANEYAILTSKRFFRYQPGRVSAGTFGVKFGRSPYTVATDSTETFYPSGDNGLTYLLTKQLDQVRHPSIKKYGIFDKFDGYYYESINEGRGDNFCCVRRTQSMVQQKSKDFFYSTGTAAQTNPRQFGIKQFEDYGNMELPGAYYDYHGDAVILRDGLINIHAGLFDPSLLKDKKAIPIAQTSSTSLFLNAEEIQISNFSYNNVTGRCTVTTKGDHGFSNGDSVTLKDILLQCNTGTKLYPNKYSQKYFRVHSVPNSTTIRTYIGVSDNNGTFEQNYISGGILNSTTETSQGTFSVTGFSYTNLSGVARVTTSTAHGLYEGELIKLTGVLLDNAGSSVTFPSDNTTLRQSNVFTVRRAVSPTEFEIGVGDTAFSKIDESYTYTSGGTVTKLALSFGATLEFSSFNYDPSTGFADIVLTGAHNLSDGSGFRLADIETECSYSSYTGPKVYPAKDDEDTFPIFNVTSNTFSFDLKTSKIVHTYLGGGRCVATGIRKGSSVYIYKKGKDLDGTVDGGIYYVNSIVGPKVTLTKSPTNGDNLTVFPGSELNAINFGTYDYRLTPNGASYNPTTGLMQLTFGSNHGLETGDSIKIADYSLAFTCDQDANASIKYYPRPENSSAANGYPSNDPVAGRYVPVVKVDDTTIEIQVLSIVPSSNGTTHTFSAADSYLTNCITVGEGKSVHLVTPAPFILPNTTNFTYKGVPNDADKDIIDQYNPYGCFPYRYVFGDADSDVLGYISTDVKLTDTQGANTIKTGIDYVNNNLLKEWVYNHVKPEFWTVYEYRVPRSRFSGEKVDGQPDRNVLYSDVVYSGGTQNFPGEEVTDVATGGELVRTSNWNLNPENVTMYKIEFSWYGAVGALFLAYVPLDSGEARWVRVHHLRASNQLKVSSLGNPTLPITYMVYGGGTQYSYGYKNSRRNINYIANSSSYSEFLVKYGASYYIDGGDRGTVRLFNYATPSTAEIYGSKLQYTLTSQQNSGDASDNTDPYPYLNIGEATNVTQLTLSDYTYLMNATVITPNREPGVKVTWVDTDNGKVYLNRTINGSTAGNFFFVVDRPRILLGLSCREAVNGVRNRIQVYPTRLSIGNSGAFATVKLVKSPAFQTKDAVNGVFNTTYDIGTSLNIGSIAKPTQLANNSVLNTNYLSNISSTYGYFRGYYDGDSSNVITIFGLLQKDASGNYFFNAYEKTNVNLLIFGNFLRAGEFYEQNPTTINASEFTPTTTPLTALSAIAISDEQRTPIPGTGQQITTLYTPSQSGEQFELQQFFDYNKDYLSFPLTDEIDTLFVLGSETSTYNSTATSTTMAAAITWEEQ